MYGPDIFWDPRNQEDVPAHMTWTPDPKVLMEDMPLTSDTSGNGGKSGDP